MPRFYFDIDDGTGLILDSEGSEHVGLEDAQHEAIETLTQMGREIFPVSSDLELTIQIRGEGGKALMQTWLTLSARRL
ncbi:MAG: hypothetical protein ABW003_19300 [Microvirga sp.]